MLMSPARPHNVTPGMQTRRLDHLAYPMYAAMFAQTHDIIPRTGAIPQGMIIYTTPDMELVAMRTYSASMLCQTWTISASSIYCNIHASEALCPILSGLMVFWCGVWMGIPPRLVAFIFARELYTPTWGKRAVTMGLYGSLFRQFYPDHPKPARNTHLRVSSVQNLP